MPMQKRWNISILVIFILLASSLLGVLSMNYVQQMMKQSATVNSYYKAYYLSKAWIELGLSTTKHRGVGFGYILYIGDSVARDNFLCWSNCSLSIAISGAASLLSQKFWQGSGCTFPYVLSTGESLIVPLIKDTYSWSMLGIFSPWIEYQNLADLFKYDKIQIQNVSSPDRVTFGLLILSWDAFYDNGVYFRTWALTTSSLNDFRTSFESYMTQIDSYFTNYYGLSQLIENGLKVYFMISNTASVDQSFCLQTTSSPLQVASVLPTNTFFIQSQASYKNQNVALDASYAQPIPSFLFNTYNEF